MGKLDDMTKKDYVILAKELSRIGQRARDLDTWWKCVEAFARALQRDNPRFNRDKFIAACSEKE